MQALKQNTIRGGMAKLLGQAVGLTLRLCWMVVLARIIEPADFGLVAMVTAVTGIFDMLWSGGLSSATIQRKDVSHAQISTLFWVNIGIGVLMAVLCLGFAPLLVAFYGDPRTGWIIAAIAPVFLFNAAGVQHYAILQREMRYVEVTMLEFGSQLIASCLSIYMAMTGWGYWALVANVVLGPLAGTIGVWWVSRWVPGRPRKDGEIGAMLRFGGTVTLNSLVVYAAYNLEKVLLGRYWGADALGLYGRAYQLINLPTQALNSAIGGVAFSALSRLQNEPARFRSYFLKGYALVLSVTIPMTMFSALFAEDIIAIVLGPKWLEAAPIFRLMAPTIVIFGVINPLSWLLLSAGLHKRSLHIALVLAPIVCGSYLLGMPYGPQGVAFAYSAAMTLWVVPHAAWCVKGTVISLYDLALAAGKPMLAGAVAALVAATLAHRTAEFGSPMVHVLLGGTVMLGVYSWILLFALQQKADFIDLFRGLRGRA